MMAPYQKFSSISVFGGASRNQGQEIAFSRIVRVVRGARAEGPAGGREQAQAAPGAQDTDVAVDTVRTLGKG